MLSGGMHHNKVVQCNETIFQGVLQVMYARLGSFHLEAELVCLLRTAPERRCKSFKSYGGLVSMRHLTQVPPLSKLVPVDEVPGVCRPTPLSAPPTSGRKRPAARLETWLAHDLSHFPAFMRRCSSSYLAASAARHPSIIASAGVCVRSPL